MRSLRSEKDIDEDARRMEREKGALTNLRMRRTEQVKIQKRNEQGSRTNWSV